MRQQCVGAVAKALGRDPNAVETRDIENRIRMARKQLAATDPDAWAKLTAAQQIEQAGARASDDLMHESALRRYRKYLNVKAAAQIQDYIKDQLASGADKTQMDAVERLLVSKADGRNNTASLEDGIKGIMATYGPKLVSSWNVASGKFLDFFRNEAAEAELVRALHGDKNVSPESAKAAADFHEMAESMRERFNAAGGDIGRLENWGMPHSWSRNKLLKLSKDIAKARQSWSDTMLPLLDRSAYSHEDGRPYTDADLRKFIDEAYTTIVTEGANKQLSGDKGIKVGVKANRNRADRQIHLNGPQAYMQAMKEFSDRGVLDTMLGHMQRMARDIATVEKFGPNADLNIRNAIATAEATDKITNVRRPGKAVHSAQVAARLYNFLAGNGAPPPETFAGKALVVYRNLNVLKLGSALWSSLSDNPTMYLTAHVNGIPALRVFMNGIRALNPLDKSDRAMAESAGLMVREFSSSLSRFGGEVGSYGLSSKFANAFMKVSLLPQVTEARRRALGSAMLNTIGERLNAAATMSDLHGFDTKLLHHSGITEQDWQIMRMAKQEQWAGNKSMITPEAIFRIPDAGIAKVTNENPDIVRSQVSSRLMAHVYSEMDRGVIEPGARTKVALGADQSADGWGAVALRSFALFKSFSFEFTRAQMFERLKLFETKKGSAAYLGALIASSLVCGAITNSIKDIFAGRDPRKAIDNPKDAATFAVQALVSGGGLGMFGDFLINTYSQSGSTLAETLAGPMVQDIGTVLNVAQGAASHAADPDGDEIEKLRPKGAALVNTLKGYSGAGSLWYTRAAMDRLVFSPLADYFSPGYLARMKQRARRQGTTYWWQPDKGLPDRAPDLGHVVAD